MSTINKASNLQKVIIPGPGITILSFLPPESVAILSIVNKKIRQFIKNWFTLYDSLNLPHLSYTHLAGCTKLFYPPAYSRILPQTSVLPMLESILYSGLHLTPIHLDLANSEINDSDVAIARRLFPQLKSMNLSQCQLITNAVGQHLVGLQEVDLSESDNIGNDAVLNLVNCSKVVLKYLQVTNAIGQSLATCKMVDLSFCYDLTDTILDGFTPGQTVVLRECNLITTAAVNAARARGVTIIVD